MDTKRYTEAEINRKLQEADTLLSQGQTLSEICQRIGITDRMYDRWRQAYGWGGRGIQPRQAERLRELEAENVRLKSEVAILAVDKLILNEVAEENVQGSARKFPSGS